MTVESEQTDVLQNIEAAIMRLYSEEPRLLDLEVMDGLKALSRRYQWEHEGRGTPSARLLPRAQLVFEGARAMCEWRLGRGPLVSDEAGPLEAVSLEVIVRCLRRLESSAKFWNKERGRQGYLQYIKQFFDRMSED